MKAGEVTINARKYDGTIHRSWSAELIRSEGNLLVFLGVFNHDVSHPELGFIRRGSQSFEFYWTDRWYNVFRFHEPDGRFRNFYCNVNLPPTFDGNSLDYIDLDLDLLVNNKFEPSVLDAAEFDSNAALYSYPDDVRRGAYGALDDLLKLLATREFPFDRTTD